MDTRDGPESAYFYLTIDDFRILGIGLELACNWG